MKEWFEGRTVVRVELWDRREGFDVYLFDLDNGKTICLEIYRTKK